MERGQVCLISEIAYEGGSFPKLGLMRLAALELLDMLQMHYGIRMLDIYREADLYTSLMKFYALYPYNDIALRYVTSILAHALDIELAKNILNTQVAKSEKQLLGRPSRGILDLERITGDKEPMKNNISTEDEK